MCDYADYFKYSLDYVLGLTNNRNSNNITGLNLLTLGNNMEAIRLKNNLSQETFAEVIGSNLVYLNQLENCKRKPTIEMLDKIANHLNKFDKDLNVTASDLIKYDENHKTNFTKIDEKK